MKNEGVVSNRRSPANCARRLAVLLAVTTGLTASAADWRQFRGPNGSGIAASDAQPATTWSDSQNVTWKVALPGPGSSSPIVAGERIFITGYSGYGDGSGGGGGKPFYASPVLAHGLLYAVSLDKFLVAICLRNI